MFLILRGTTTIKCVITLTFHIHTPDVQTQEGLTDDDGPYLLYLFVSVESCRGRNDGSTHTGNCGLVVLDRYYETMFFGSNITSEYPVLIIIHISILPSLGLKNSQHATATAHVYYPTTTTKTIARKTVDPPGFRSGNGGVRLFHTTTY